MTHREDSLQRHQFIAMAPNSWEGQWMNRQQLFSRIGSRARSLYSQGLPYIWNLKSGSGRPWRSRFRPQNGVLVDEPGRLLFRWPRLSGWTHWALKRHAGHLQGGLEGGLENDKTRVLYLFHPSFWPYVELLHWDLLVYHPYDDFSRQAFSSDWGMEEERQLMARADLVLTPSSDVTRNLAERYGREDVTTLRNGVDFEAFRQGPQLPCPTDLAAIPQPRVGYIGGINRKVDLALLQQLARDLPQCHFVLVGPLGELGDKQLLMADLQSRANVHFLGARDYRALPAYAGHMDCHLMCYDTSPALWAHLAYPLKLNEYLATGKPLVSCPLNSVDEQEALMAVCDRPDTWRDAILAALDRPREKSEAGIAYAARQSWDLRVNQLAELLAGLASPQRPNRAGKVPG